MTSWTDSYGRWHDKPTVNGKPSSNNGYIYSAYANNLGRKINPSSLKECYERSLIDASIVNFTRHPPEWMNGKIPPPSRDEVIGLISLGILDVRLIEENNWCFYIQGLPLDELDWVLIMLELRKLKDQHRNMVWQGNYQNAMQVAFRLAPHDVYYIKSLIGKNPKIGERFAWTGYVNQMSTTNDWSAKNICILQMEDLGMDISDMKKDVSYRNYFTIGRHPFTELQG